ncbi:MAG: FAD-binding protein [Candidatus Daviesbacteria bacterium]|nr:FAD-binding protein [Candidatus Daviesbacteria bacterium]
MDRYKLIIDTLGKERFKFDEPISDHAASNIGGKAKVFFIVFSVWEISKIVDMCQTLKLPFFIFGTGSKIMISDQGLDCLVIKNRTRKIEIISVKGRVSKIGIGVEEALVEVESGVSINRFIEFLDSQNLKSDDLGRISGSIGGNLFINKILQNMVKSIKVLDLNSRILEIGAKDLSLRKHIILSAVFQIKSKLL